MDTGSSLLRWLLPVLALLALAALIWLIFFRDRTPTTPTTPTSTRPTERVTIPTGTTLPTNRSSSFTNPVETVNTQVTNFFKSATESFTDIKDAASAEKAEPKLKELAGTLDTLKTGLSALGSDTRSTVVNSIKGSATTLTELIDKVLKIPGVKEKIGPIVESLKTKLAGLTTT